MRKLFPFLLVLILPSSVAAYDKAQAEAKIDFVKGSHLTLNIAYVARVGEHNASFAKFNALAADVAKVYDKMTPEDQGLTDLHMSTAADCIDNISKPALDSAKSGLTWSDVWLAFADGFYKNGNWDDAWANADRAFAYHSGISFGTLTSGLSLSTAEISMGSVSELLKKY